MECEARKDQILLYALDELESPALEELRAHLQTGCPACVGRLAEANAILALLPASLPSSQVPEEARKRLLNRIGGGSGGQSALLTKAARGKEKKTGGLIWLTPFAAGALAAACVAVVLHVNAAANYRRLLESAARQAAGYRGQIQALRTEVDRENDFRRRVVSGAVQLAWLNGKDGQPGPKAVLVWEPQSRSIRFYADDMKTLASGRTYELWLITSRSAIPAGVFTVDAHGQGAIQCCMEADPGRVTKAAVSEEAAPGASTPSTDKILLSGKLE